MKDFLSNIWPRALRPFIAWLAACWMAGLVLFLTYLIADNGLGEGLSRQSLGPLDPVLAATLMTPVIAILTALPTVLLVFLARQFRWRRGMAEVLAGATVPFVLLSIFFASQYNSLADSWPGVLMAGTFVPAGVAGGLVYWWLAGNKRA